MTALQAKFFNVTLVCDDSLTIYNHKVVLEDINTVSKGLLQKHASPHPLVYVRGAGDQNPVQIPEGIENRP